MRDEVYLGHGREAGIYTTMQGAWYRVRYVASLLAPRLCTREEAFNPGMKSSFNPGMRSLLLGFKPLF